MISFVRNLLIRMKNKPRTIEERITLGLVTEQEAAILPPHHKRLYDKWKAKLAKK